MTIIVKTPHTPHSNTDFLMTSQPSSYTGDNVDFSQVASYDNWLINGREQVNFFVCGVNAPNFKDKIITNLIIFYVHNIEYIGITT